jgi:membrane protein
VFGLLESLKDSVIGSVWGTPLSSLPRRRRRIVKAVRILYMLGRELASGTLTMRAASLVFTTLLSLVPLLAVSFSLLKAFGVHTRYEIILSSVLEPLGAQGVEIATRIVGFVDQVKVGVLGGVGLLILFVTVISLVRKVEDALNTTWRVRASRNVVQRVSGYLSVMLVGPLLVFAALGLIGTLMSTSLVQALVAVEPFGSALALAPRLLPYVLMAVAFTSIYAFMPNARVQLRSALVGGAVAGVLWASAGWAFASFVANSPNSNYAAIYSSFAIVFVFMLWMYVAWLILLIGGTVAFYHQMPEYLGVMPGQLKASNQLRERIALAAMLRIGSHHFHAREPLSSHALAQHMQLPLGLVQDAVQALQDDGFVALVEQPVGGYVPARDLAKIALVDLLASTRSAHGHKYLVPDQLPAEPVAEALMQDLERSAATVLGQRTLRDLVVAQEPQDENLSPAATAAPHRAN